MAACANASAMMAGCLNSAPKPRWMIGCRKPGRASQGAGCRDCLVVLWIPTHKHPHQHIVGPLVPLEYVFVQDGLPSFLVDLRLKEHEKVMVAGLLTEILLEAGRHMHVADGRMLRLPDRTLIGLVVRILMSERGRRRGEGVEREQMMNDMILIIR